MEKGIKFVLCVITVVLVMIAERGVPVKLTKSSCVTYFIFFGGLLKLVDYLI